MGWYIRKSFSAGPARLNLSKSGLGLSFGAKGARVGMGPRGLYTHFGRGGLYYRSSYGGSPSVDVQSRNNSLHDNISSDGRGELFDDKQVSYRKLSLDFSFKISRKREWIYFGIGTLAFIIAASLEDISFVSFSLLAILGIVMYFLIIFKNIKYWISKQKSDRLYHKLKNECKHDDGGNFKVNIEKVGTIIDKYKAILDEGYLKRAFYLFYMDYLSAVVSDCHISSEESIELKKVEEFLNLDKDLLIKVKRCMFNKAYLIVIKDKFFTKEEEDDLCRIKDIFSLSDEDVAEELETLTLLKEARKIGEGNLNPTSVDLSLNKNELCYHKTKGRIVKEKVLKSYQEQGVRHNVKGLVTEKEGELYLTSQRIIIVGEGVYNIKLEKIFDIETDIDTNTIVMDIDGRKSSLILTVPDSLIFSAKLNKLKSN
jgi:hypothetical protein